MIPGFLRRSIAAAVLVLAVSTASAADLDEYREFRLGITTAAVSALTRTAAADVKTLYEQQPLLQQLTWRPRYAAGRPIPDFDPVRKIVFSFVDNQLFEIAVEYDWSRTAGLTVDDVVTFLETIYGPRSPIAADIKDSWFDVNAVVTAVATWQQAKTRMALQHVQDSGEFRLIITSARLQAAARTAQTAAEALLARDAPGRDAALAQRQADDARAAIEKIRSTNMTRFRP